MSGHHHDEATKQGPVRVAVLTVSDTRTAETDESGRYLRGSVMAEGHRVCAYRLVPDEPEQVLGALDEMLAADDAPQIVIVSGGTGISRRDTTYDALAPRLEKILPGFGEIFRALSFAEIGPAAMLSRAIAGTYRGALVFSLPGSRKAVRLAWEQLISQELAHIAWELTR